MTTRNRKALGTALLTLAASIIPLAGQTNPLNPTPAQFTFTATSASMTPDPQLLQVASSSGPALNFTAAAFSGGNWLTVSAAAGTTPQTLSVSVDPSRLGMGSYGGYITLTAGGMTTTIPVVLNVNANGASSTVTSPTSLSFTFPVGSTTAQRQLLNVTNLVNPTAAYTATPSTNSGGAFLSIVPTASNAPSTLTVSVNPAGLGLGNYFGAITIASPGTSGIVIPVQVNIGTVTAININPERISWAYQTNTPGPDPQVVNLTTSIGGPVAFTVMANYDLCYANWFTVMPQSGYAPGSFSVKLNTTGLMPGNCAGTIYISAPGAVNPNFSIPVTLFVSNNPVLQIPQGSPVITYQVGAAPPAAQMLQIGSSSTPLNFSVIGSSANGGPTFLNFSQTSGTTPQTITLSVDPMVLAGLMPNTYAENVTITSPDAANGAQTFTVTLVVTGAAGH